MNAHEKLIDNIMALQKNEQFEYMAETLNVILNLMNEVATGRFQSAQYHTTHKHDNLTIDIWWNK